TIMILLSCLFSVAALSAHFRASYNINEIDQKITNNIDWSHQPKPEHIGLNQVISKLDSKYHEIIDLIYFKGYTQQEVHEHLDIPLGTVKSRLRIALRELRKIFDLYQVPIIILLSFLYH
ncbi:MAG: sigma factor-like helix-turn-helix DNA-binding protein, partial [Bacteroidota bacterium]